MSTEISNQESMKAGKIQYGPRRLGKLKVSFALLRDWESLLPAMRELVVVHAESFYVGQYIIYTAFCRNFDVVELGVEPPEYLVTFTKHENGIITCQFSQKYKNHERTHT
jgi:hypothetical protein